MLHAVGKERERRESSRERDKWWLYIIVEACECKSYRGALTLVLDGEEGGEGSREGAVVVEGEGSREGAVGVEEKGRGEGERSREGAVGVEGEGGEEEEGSWEGLWEWREKGLWEGRGKGL